MIFRHFTRADYAFKEWNTKADGSGTTYSNTQLRAETISSNTDYYAMWTPENPDNAVTLTFSPTGCDAQVTPASMTVVRGDTIYAYQMPTPTKTQQQVMHTHLTVGTERLQNLILLIKHHLL